MSARAVGYFRSLASSGTRVTPLGSGRDICGSGIWFAACSVALPTAISSSSLRQYSSVRASSASASATPASSSRFVLEGMPHRPCGHGRTAEGWNGRTCG